MEGGHGFGIGGKSNFQMLNRKPAIFGTPRFRFKKGFEPTLMFNIIQENRTFYLERIRKESLVGTNSVTNRVSKHKNKYPELSTKPTTKVVIFRSKQLLSRPEFKSYE